MPTEDTEDTPEQTQVPAEQEGQEMAYMTVGEARDFLGVSNYKINQLLRAHNIPRTRSQREARFKLVPRAAIEELARSFANDPTAAHRFQHT